MKILPMTKNAIYKMVERGEIPGATKIGRRVMFREDLIERWLDDQLQPCTSGTRR